MLRNTRCHLSGRQRGTGDGRGKRLISGYCKLKDNTDDALRKLDEVTPASDCQICGHDIDNHGRSGCTRTGCSCLRTYARTDHPNYAEQDARIAALTEQVSQADRANGELLRRLQTAEDRDTPVCDGTRGQSAWALRPSSGWKTDHRNDRAYGRAGRQTPFCGRSARRGGSLRQRPRSGLGRRRGLFMPTGLPMHRTQPTRLVR